jgi:hypothetical protein
MTHQLAAGCAFPASALVLTVQLLPPAISKIIILVRSKNLGMAAHAENSFAALLCWSRHLWTFLRLTTAQFHFRLPDVPDKIGKMSSVTDVGTVARSE